MKLGQKITASILSVSLLLPMGFVGNAEASGEEKARNYINNFQSMDFQSMMNNSYSGNLDSVAGSFQERKSGMSGLFEGKNTDIDSKIGNAKTSYEGKKSSLSSEVNSENSSLFDKFKGAKSSMGGDAKSKIKSENKDYDAMKKSLVNQYSSGSKSTAKQAATAVKVPTTSGGKYGSGGSGGSSYGLPSLAVGPEKRGQISQNAKGLADQFKGLSAQPTYGGSIESNIQGIIGATDFRVKKHNDKGSHTAVSMLKDNLEVQDIERQKKRSETMGKLREIRKKAR